MSLGSSRAQGPSLGKTSTRWSRTGRGFQIQEGLPSCFLSSFCTCRELRVAAGCEEGLWATTSKSLELSASAKWFRGWLPHSQAWCGLENGDRCGNAVRVPGTWQCSDGATSLLLPRPGLGRASHVPAGGLNCGHFCSAHNPASSEAGVWQPARSRWSPNPWQVPASLALPVMSLLGYRAGHLLLSRVSLFRTRSN